VKTKKEFSFPKAKGQSSGGNEEHCGMNIRRGSLIEFVSVLSPGSAADRPHGNFVNIKLRGNFGMVGQE
jgi:hypothetical protein